MKGKIAKKGTIIAWILLPIFFTASIISFHSTELIRRPLQILSILISVLTIIYLMAQIILDSKKTAEKESKTVLQWLGRASIVVEGIGAITFLFLLYAPFSNFRSWLIPTAMTTMSHQYLATWFYSAEEINKVLSENQVLEIEENTNPDLIQMEESTRYENEFERQVLEREKDAIYKIIPISEKNYKGYLAIIYDSSRIVVSTTKYLEERGQYVTEMAAQEHAILAINGGGFVDPNYNSSGGSPQGIVIKNGKVITNRSYDATGGLIGFTKANKLVLGRMSSEEALNLGVRDALSFGPFLIVNGKKAFIKGNGGWGTAPRTAIAQRQDGIVLMVAVDGRTIANPGASMLDLTNLLSDYGAYNAANLDGGTSTVMVLPMKEAKKYLKDSELEEHCRKEYCQINDPVDSTGAHKTRPIASSFLVK